MLGKLMRLRLLDMSYGSGAVQYNKTIIGGCHFKFVDELSQPHSFFRSIRYYDIFYLANRVCHSVLLETFSADHSIIQDKNITQHSLAVIMVRLKAGVGELYKFQVSFTIHKSLVLSIFQILKNGLYNILVVFSWIRLASTHYTQ